MKKIFSFILGSLTLMMGLSSGIIPATANTDKGEWQQWQEGCYSYIKMIDIDTQKIDIYTQHTKYTKKIIFWDTTRYKNRIKFVAKDNINGTIKTYISTEVESKEPLAGIEICKRDKTLNKEDVFSNLELYYASNVILEDKGAEYFSNVGNAFINAAIDDIVDDLSSETVSFLKEVVGIKTPIQDILDAADGAKEQWNNFAGFVSFFLDFLRGETEKALPGETDTIIQKYKNMRQTAFDNLFSTITSIANVEEEEPVVAIKPIEEAMQAYFETAICGHQDRAYAARAGTIEYAAVVSDDVMDSMVKTCPLEVWNTTSYAYDRSDYKDIFTSYIGLFWDYVRGYYVYNAGSDYLISYEIIATEKMDSVDLKAYEEKLTSISALRGLDLNSDYVKEESAYHEFVPVIKDSLDDAYRLTVKYTVEGSKQNWEAVGEYTAINTNGKWYILKDDHYSVDYGRWDNTITQHMSNAWIPRN